MRREHLEHIIRAAADVADDDEIVVVGSQAILATYPDAPPALLVSQEADVYPRNRPERATAIDGNMGDGSAFHEAFGYYAHGVGPETAKAPAGWEGRLVAVRVKAGRGKVATGWCMEAHDVVLAKCAARRERDWAYADAAIPCSARSLNAAHRGANFGPCAPSGRARGRACRRPAARRLLESRSTGTTAVAA